MSSAVDKKKDASGAGQQNIEDIKASQTMIANVKSRGITHFRLFLWEDGGYPENAEQYSIPVDSAEWRLYEPALMGLCDVWLRCAREVDRVLAQSVDPKTRKIDHDVWWNTCRTMFPGVCHDIAHQAIQKYRISKDSCEQPIFVAPYEALIMTSMVWPNHTLAD